MGVIQKGLKSVKKMYGKAKGKAIEKIKSTAKNIYTDIKERNAMMKFDFLDAMEKEFENSTDKSESARLWYRENVRKNKKYRPDGGVVKAGYLYIFEYLRPINVKSLKSYDKQPLVFVLDVVETPKGMRAIGINFHFLPPEIRIIVFNDIYERHKRQLSRGFVRDKNEYKVDLDTIMKQLIRVGGDYAIRMYDVKRIITPKEFKIKDWSKAIYLPTRRYKGTNIREVILEHKKHLKGRIGRLKRYESNKVLREQKRSEKRLKDREKEKKKRRDEMRKRVIKFIME